MAWNAIASGSIREINVMQELDNLINVYSSDSQLTQEQNRIWIQQQSNSVQVPTYDEFNDLKSASGTTSRMVGSYLKWESGTINNGAEEDNNKRIRTDISLLFPEGTVIDATAITQNAGLSVREYDAQGHYLGQGGWVSSYTCAKDEYLRFIMRNGSDTVVSDIEALSNMLKVTYPDSTNLLNRIMNTENVLSVTRKYIGETDIMPTFEIGSISTTTGENEESSTRIRTTEIIFFPKGSTIDSSEIGVNSSTGLRIYDANGHYITYASWFKTRTFTDDTYAKIVARFSDDSTITSASMPRILNKIKITNGKDLENELDSARMGNLILDGIIEWELGSISVGANIDNVTNRIRIKNPVLFRKGTSFDPSAIQQNYAAMLVFKYDANGNYISGAGNWIKSYVCQETEYLRVVVRLTGDATITNIYNTASKVKITYSENGYKELVRMQTQYPLTTLTNGILLEYKPDEFKYTKVVGADIAGNQNRVQQIYNLWDQLMTDYPGYVTKKTIGTDQSGLFDINAYTLSSKNDNGVTNFKGITHLKMIFVSCIHGNESPYISREDYLLAKEILDNHTDASTANLWSYVDIIFVPLANPYGVEYNLRNNSREVNINRNFDYDWVYVDKDQDSYNYGGTSANSEAETLALINLFDENPDAICVIGHHNTATFTDGNKLGYFQSYWNTDLSILRMISNMLDTQFKTENNWIFEVSANKTRNIIPVSDRVVSPDMRHGEMTNYACNVKKLHGLLLEFGSSAGSSYPSATSETLHQMGIECLCTVLSGYLKANNYLMREAECPKYFGV